MKSNSSVMKIWSDRRRLYNQNGIRRFCSVIRKRTVIRFYWTIIWVSNSGTSAYTHALAKCPMPCQTAWVSVYFYWISLVWEEFRLVSLINTFLFPETTTKVLLRGKSWRAIPWGGEKGVPHGSVLGPLLFITKSSPSPRYLNLTFCFIIFFVASFLSF